jgi:hypothetical protein
MIDAWILVGHIPCPRTGAKTVAKDWHSVVDTVLSQLRHLAITGPGLKWDCADRFQPQCYSLFAACVRDYPEQVMVAQVSSGRCPGCEKHNGMLMGH